MALTSSAFNPWTLLSLSRTLSSDRAGVAAAWLPPPPPSVSRGVVAQGQAGRPFADCHRVVVATAQAQHQGLQVLSGPFACLMNPGDGASAHSKAHAQSVWVEAQSFVGSSSRE